jgi:hypothetical protein
VAERTAIYSIYQRDGSIACGNSRTAALGSESDREVRIWPYRTVATSPTSRRAPPAEGHQHVRPGLGLLAKLCPYVDVSAATTPPSTYLGRPARTDGRHPGVRDPRPAGRRRPALTDAWRCPVTAAYCPCHFPRSGQLRRARWGMFPDERRWRRGAVFSAQEHDPNLTPGAPS